VSEPPPYIQRALMTWWMNETEDDDVDGAVEAVWNALLEHGEQWTRIGRTFYDDTDEGQPVLVIPLSTEADSRLNPDPE
jgi:hypothetical protein